MSRRPSLNECFPDPFSGQWPETHNPVLSQCQKLYALVSLCCCTPGAHLLVCKNGGGQRVNMLNSMPKGPKYFDYTISARTSPVELSAFLIRAEMSAMHNPGRQPSRQGGEEEEHDGSNGAAGSTTRGLTPLSTGSNVPAFQWGANCNGKQRAQYMVVVCLLGIETASPAVLSTLVDALTFGVTPSGNAVRRIKSVRVVAFCEAVDFATTLPSSLRNAFALSLYVSNLAIDNAAVIQAADPNTSNIVNKRCMLEVALSEDGPELVDSVRFSGHVARYLRHLMIIVRSSSLINRAPGSSLPARYPLLARLLKVAALLFYNYSHAPLLPGGHRNGLSIGTSSTKEFRRVAVSPSDVVCLFPNMVAHLLTVQYAMLPSAWRQGRSEAGLLDGNGIDALAGKLVYAPSMIVDVLADNVTPSGAPLSTVSFDEDLAVWDARAVQWSPAAALRRERQVGVADTAVGISDDTLMLSLQSIQTMMEPTIDRARGNETLTYEQVRELIRLSLLECSDPPPG